MKYDFALFVIPNAFIWKKGERHWSLKVGSVCDLQVLEDDLLRGTQESVVSPLRTENSLGF